MRIQSPSKSHLQTRVNVSKVCKSHLQQLMFLFIAASTFPFDLLSIKQMNILTQIVFIIGTKTRLNWLIFNYNLSLLWTDKWHRQSDTQISLSSVLTMVLIRREQCSSVISWPRIFRISHVINVFHSNQCLIVHLKPLIYSHKKYSYIPEYYFAFSFSFLKLVWYVTYSLILPKNSPEPIHTLNLLWILIWKIIYQRNNK